MPLKINLLSVIGIIFLISCNSEKQPSKSVIKIKDAVLSEEEINSALGEYRNQATLREEYISKWIEREILFQEAKNKGLLNDAEYNSIIEISKRELAASILLSKILEENKYDPSDDELKKFFESTKDDFVLSEDSYKINVAYFNNEDKAIQFRKILIESDWLKAVSAFRNENSLMKSDYGIIVSAYQIQSNDLQKIISNLALGEISIIFETEPSKFGIVQLVDITNKGMLPTFESVKGKVRDRLLVIRNKELIRKYINELIADYNIEIKRYEE